MIALGIDAGTRTIKAVVTNEDKVLASVVVPCGKESTAATAVLARHDALAKGGLSLESVVNIAATGAYGDRVSFAAYAFPEGVCLAKGMNHLNPSVHSVLDVGSVRASAIRCQEGRLTGIAVNDRCAAGTGAFVEVLSGFLKLPIEELGEVALKASEPVDFLNTCAIHIESEVLSLLLSGKKMENVLAGALRGFASRVFSILIGMGVEMDVAMVGGLAKNRAVVKAIEENLGAALFVPQEPEIIPALGAALLAGEKG